MAGVDPSDPRTETLGGEARPAAPAPVPPPEGGDRYRVERELARGGFGRVLRAFALKLQRPVAIKELLPDASPGARARFLREALIASRLEHPAIVPVHDQGVWPSGVPYFAMKLVGGESLQALLGR